MAVVCPRLKDAVETVFFLCTNLLYLLSGDEVDGRGSEVHGCHPEEHELGKGKWTDFS